jgi:hypothetical protein
MRRGEDEVRGRGHRRAIDEVGAGPSLELEIASHLVLDLGD